MASTTYKANPDTPLTNNEARKLHDLMTDRVDYGTEFVPAEFARSLERDLRQLLQASNEMLVVIESKFHGEDMGPTLSGVVEAYKALTKRRP